MNQQFSEKKSDLLLVSIVLLVKMYSVRQCLNSYMGPEVSLAIYRDMSSRVLPEV
jgi:hypothetical protein